LQKISRADQVWIETNEYASSNRPDRALDYTDEILDSSPEAIRQYGIAVNCLMTEADSPGTIVNDVPGSKYCAEPLNLDSSGGTCEILLEAL